MTKFLPWWQPSCSIAIWQSAALAVQWWTRGSPYSLSLSDTKSSAKLEEGISKFSVKPESKLSPLKDMFFFWDCIHWYKAWIWKWINYYQTFFYWVIKRNLIWSKIKLLSLLFIFENKLFNMHIDSTWVVQRSSNISIFTYNKPVSFNQFYKSYELNIEQPPVRASTDNYTKTQQTPIFKNINRQYG